MIAKAMREMFAAFLLALLGVLIGLALYPLFQFLFVLVHGHQY